MNRWWAASVAAIVVLVSSLSGCSSGPDEEFDPDAAQVLAFDIHSSVEGHPSEDWATVMELYGRDLNDGHGQVHERAVGIFLARTGPHNDDLYSAVMDTASDLNKTPLLGQRYLAWLEGFEGQAAMFPEEIVEIYLRDLSGSRDKHAKSDAATIEEIRLALVPERSASQD